ncbi:MAG: biotin/lipoyl-containing protein [Chloroflexota bacterium]
MGQGTGGATARTSRYLVTVGGAEHAIEVVEDASGTFVRVNDGERLPIEVLGGHGATEISARVGRRILRALVRGEGDRHTVVVDGRAHEVSVQDERAARLAAASRAARPGGAGETVKAPMPGLVVRVSVEVGQVVERGARLVVLQAMKMENELTASHGGTVRGVNVQPGQTVEQGQALVTLE